MGPEMTMAYRPSRFGDEPVEFERQKPPWRFAAQMEKLPGLNGGFYSF